MYSQIQLLKKCEKEKMALVFQGARYTIIPDKTQCVMKKGNRETEI